MRHTFVPFACALTLFATTAVAAPMSGFYTVGGTSPSFTTLQQAADSLMVRGVSGAVEIRLRPGTYMQNGGVDRVLFLSDPIPGSSAARTVTFTPDFNAGGNVDNVVLAVNKTSENGVGVAEVRADHVRFRSLTFADRDSGQAGARYLLLFIGTVPTNSFLEGLEVMNCKFIGNPFSASSMALNTDYGINGFDDDVQDIVVRGCTFRRLLRPIEFGQDGGDVPGTIVIESNTVLENRNAVTGTGNPVGVGIQVGGRNVSVRNNLIDFADGSGFGGIIARIHDTGVVERNYVKNGGPVAFTGIQVEDFFFHDTDSVKVVNNMVSGLTTGVLAGIKILARRTLIAHNTVVLTALEGGNDRCLHLDASDCRLFSNILDLRGTATTGFHVVFEMFGSSSATLVSDFNVFNRGPSGPLVYDAGTFHPSLASWRNASGEDQASVVRELEFVHLGQDVHLSECQAQDLSLAATPLPAVSRDFDDQLRNRWVRGADEALTIMPRLFDAVRIGLAGTPFGVDAAPFDNPTADGLAVTDYDNNQVHLFHNLPASRSFTPAGSLGVPFQPTCVRFMDLDVDGKLDLIVGGEAAAVVVYWGNGVGGFPDSAVVPTSGRVVSIEPQPFAISAEPLCLLAEDNGFLPDRSFLGVIKDMGGRNLCHDLTRKQLGLHPVDTLSSTLKDIVAADFSPDQGFEIAGIALGPGLAGKLVSFTDFAAEFAILTQCDDVFFSNQHTITPAPIASYGGNNANIAHGDFDADGDVDMVTTGFTSSQCVLLRNNGTMGFTSSTLDVNDAVAVVALDYEDDGDLDIASINRQLENNGVTLFRNDGTGTFARSLNCFQPFGSGTPFGAATGDFDLDGLPDIAIVTSFDSLFVLYNAAPTFTGVRPPLASAPGPALAPCTPNPVVGSARIGFTLPARTHVRLALFDMQGRRMATLVDEVREAGRHETHFVPRALPSGTYLCRLEAGGSARSRKLMVVR